MRVGFVPPKLQHLDTAKSDAISLCLFKEDWPLHGTPGLVDWRVGGHLSRLRERGWISCDAGEIVLMPLGRRLPCERLFLLGLGSVEEGLERGSIESSLHKLFEALEKLQIHATVMHLPGRPHWLSPEDVMEMLLNVSKEHPNQDEVVVVEPHDVQRVMERIIESRRTPSVDPEMRA